MKLIRQKQAMRAPATLYTRVKERERERDNTKLFVTSVVLSNSHDKYDAGENVKQDIAWNLDTEAWMLKRTRDDSSHVTLAM